jgi:ribosomal-protein-alanine N-acetyltransferase
MPSPEPVNTSRLRLVPTTPELLRADASDRPLLSRHLGCAIAPSWPQPLWGGALLALGSWLKPDEIADGWGPWYILLRDPPTLIGTLGFKGRPDSSGVVEVGYGVVDEHQRRGHAPEAVAAIIQWAMRHGARTILAHTFERHTASIRVLEKCGFRFAGPGTEEVDESERQGMGELVLFRLDRRT